MPKVNLNDVEAWTGDGAGPTPDGWHHIIVEEIEDRNGPSAGDYWNLTLLIDQGAYADRNLFDNLFFTAKTAGKLKQVLEACKVKIPAGDFDLKHSTLKNKKAWVLVRREAYVDGEGKDNTRPVVVAWNAVEGAANGAAGVENLAGKFNATPEAPKKATADDDSIPF